MKKVILLKLFTIAFLFAFAQKEKLPVIKFPVFKKDTVSIRKYGAVADGNTLNTKSINATIDALSKKGGGVVLVPSGLWLTGPIILKNNINLHLAAGATLLFTADKNEYPLIEANWEDCHRCVINHQFLQPMQAILLLPVKGSLTAMVMDGEW